MALSATFTANFSSFYDAVDKAETKLKDFGAGADKVGGRLTALGNSFSGVKIIQDATLMVKAVEDIGGASKLTEKELARLGATTNEAVAKMKALGMDVPKNLQEIADKTKSATKATTDWTGSLTTVAGSFKQIAGAIGVGFGVTQAINFGKAIVEDAGHIADMSAKLGISAEAVQRFGYAASQTGASMDTIGGAIGKMNVNLAGGDKSTVAALDSIGLQFKDIRAMKPEDAFATIAQAIARIPDPMLQAEAATKLFGKTGLELLPAINANLIAIGNSAKVMSDHTIEELDKAGDEWGRFVDNIKVSTAGFMVWAKENAQKYAFGVAGFVTQAAAGLVKDTHDVVYGQGKIIADAAKSLTTALAKIPDPLAKIGVSAKKTSGLLEDYDVIQKQAEKNAEKLAAAQKTAADAAETHRKKIADLAATLSGVGLSQKTKDLTEAVALMALQYGRATLNSQATVDAVRALAKEGAALTPILLDIYLKHLDWEAAGTKVHVGIKDLLADLPNYTQQLKNFMSVQFFDFDLPDFKTQIGSLFENLPNLAGVFKAWGDTNIKAPFKHTVEETNAVVGLVATAFDTLGQHGGTAWKVAMQFSEIAITGMIRYKGAITDADRETVKMQTTTAIATTAMSFGIDFAISQWQKYRSQVAAAQGTIAQLQAQITALGEVPVGGPIVTDPTENPYLDTSLVAKLKQQIKNIQQEQENARKAQDELNAAIQKYGLTFKDFDRGPVQALTIIRDEFLSTANALIKNGYKVSSVIHGMRDDLNEVVRTALETRQKLPESFAPFLAQLVRAGDLADDVKRKLLGLADPAPWEDMQTAAEKYGIALGDLGQAFQQSRLDSMSQELLHDWNLLVTHGANVNAVIEGMSGKVNELVHDSLKFGTDIPANMRPMLQAMVDAGLLTDAEGNKLTDLTKLHFAEDLAADFEKLIAKLDELIEKLGGDGGAHPNSVTGAAEKAADAVEASFNNVRINPIHVPYVFDAENPPDFDVDAGARARAPHLASGGIVTRPTFALIGEAGPEAVVPLGAGGALGTTVIINAQGALFDTPGDLQRLADRVNDALTAKYGLRNAMRAG